MKTTTELFGENLRYKLIEQRKNQADIARYLKVTEATVSRWVNGLSMPRSNMIDPQKRKRTGTITAPVFSCV